tara:strand:+ start:360 stop:947 length:588 start_codon:yes stop_codon:yes gene_type:complete
MFKSSDYISSTLTFNNDSILWTNPHDNKVYEVMMSWEQPIMNKMAELAVSEGDDVLELGFGMGILSNAIQARKPKSHTIVECHPEIIIKLKEWASDKTNVTIVEGDWLEKTEELSTYDAILQDTYADDNLHNFVSFVFNVAKPGCKVTWWNNKNSNTDWSYLFDDYNLTLTDVDVDPPVNEYYNEKNYKIPLKII